MSATRRAVSVTLAMRFLNAVVRHLRWRLVWAAVLSITLAFGEGAGVLLLIPLLATIGLTVADGPTGGLAGAVELWFSAAGLRPNLTTVLAVFLGVSIMHALLYRAHLLLNPRLEQRFAQDLRERLYRAIVCAEWSFFTSRRPTDIVHALTIDVDRAGGAVYQLLSLLTGAAVSAVYIAIAVRLSPALTLLVAAAGAVMLWGLRRRTHRSGEMGELYSDANRQQFHMASESIAGLKVAKSLGAERRAIGIFAGLAHRRAAAYLALLRSFARSKMAIDISSAVTISVLLLIAVNGLALRGAGLLMLVFVFSRVMPRIMSLQESAQLVAAGLPSFDLVTSLVEACEAHAEQTPRAPARRIPLRHGLRLDAISYSYDAAGPPALNAISLEVQAGRTIAIVGPSGAGKSTLADILIGLLRPTRGHLLVDGRPLADADLADWRTSIAYVPQESFLLHDTIRANLLWARPDASEQAMWKALDLAAAAEFVRARADGLDAIVGDRGLRLSGGERQRLALARALLTDPDILLLDEATSALDAINEEKILGAVSHLAGRVTTILITHRLSAVRGADVIHVLDEGALVESGTWGALACGDGVFSAMLRAQGLHPHTHTLDQPAPPAERSRAAT